jgi:serine/threonine protein kinase
MAPEMIKQERCGRKADIWSLGCTMIEMATGHPPWGKFKNPLQALLIISQEEGPPPLPENLSELAKDFLMKCLQPNPKNRWTAKKLLDHEFLQISIRFLAQINVIGRKFSKRIV